MKSLKLIIAGSLLLCLTQKEATAQNKFNYTIDGTIKNITPMPQYVYKQNGEDTDSAKVVDGKYRFQGNVSEVTSISIAGKRATAVVNYMDFVQFYLSPGQVKVETDATFKESVVTGPGADVNTEVNKALVNVINKIKGLSSDIKKAYGDKDVQAQAKLAPELVRITEMYVTDGEAYLKANPNSSANVVLMQSIIRSKAVKMQEITALIAQMNPENQKLIKSKFQTDLEEKGKNEEQENANLKIAPVGSTALEFSQNDPNGKSIALSSYKGKYVLVDFWASWCAPCRAENPNVLMAYNKYKDKGFTVLGVSLDGQSQKQAWIDAIAKDKMPWTQVSDLKGFGNQAAELYGIVFIPQNVLIDPNGVIIAKNLRGKELLDKLASLFK